MKVGDEVKVRTEFPEFGWGSVSPDEVGVVVEMFNINEGNVSVFVDFPNHPGWEGYIDELEVVPKKKPTPNHLKYQPII
ncbi:MAG: hypothetical protein H6546_07510 [Chitinophagales bacterium]|nr:hypothetical protein [Chitinophagales bacterium]